MHSEYEKDEAAQILARPTMTVAEALKVLPISRNGIYEAIRRGDIKTVRVGKKILSADGSVAAAAGHGRTPGRLVAKPAPDPPQPEMKTPRSRRAAGAE